jgi:hypothetical protein
MRRGFVEEGRADLGIYSDHRRLSQSASALDPSHDATKFATKADRAIRAGY